MLHFLESRVLHKFGILLHGRFIYSPHLLIRAIIYLYPYGLMNIYVMFWIIIQYYLFLCSKCFSFGHWGLFQLVLYLFDTPSLLCVCVCALCVCVFSIFLLSGIIRCSRLILYISCPSPRISHFSRSRILKTKICMQSMRVATGMSLFLGPLH